MDPVTHALFMGVGKKKQGRWVAVGSGGLVVSSDDDGVTWDARTSPASRDWANVIFANGKFVAVGSGSGTASKIMHSSDGETWASATGTGVGGYNWVDVAYGPKLIQPPTFIAFASGRKIVSLDGESWAGSSPHPPSGTNWRAITPALVNGFILLRSSSNGSDSATIVAGNSDQEWVSQTDAKVGEWYSICAVPGIGAVAVGGTLFANQVMTSAGTIGSGAVWTVRTPAVAQNWISVCYGAGLFVAVGHNNAYTNGYIMTSSNGITWANRGTFAGRPFAKVAYGGGRFLALAAGAPTYIITSLDGISWSEIGSFSGDGLALAYGEF